MWLYFLTVCFLIRSVYSATTQESKRIILSSQALSIDLKSCVCLPMIEECEVAISKSILSTEIECPENFNYCCKGLKEPQNNDKFFNHANLTRTREESMKNDKTKEVYDILKTPQKTEPISIVPRRPKPHKDCLCTTRSGCEEKDTDYSFGFYCTHNQVHCCPPKAAINNIPDKKLNDTFLISPQDSLAKPCKCVLERECRETNDITKRKDTLCPFNLIECCGVEITKKIDIITGDITSLGLVEGRGMGFTANGQKSFSQPIQLPESKLPEVYHEAWDTTTATTLPPPDLPSQYHNPERINSANFYAQRPALQPIQRFPYYGNQPPYWQPRRTSFYQVSERSSSSSFADSLWNFFFTG